MTSADTLTAWLALVDEVDRCATDMMTAKPGDEAPGLDFSASVETLREAIQQARLDALREESRHGPTIDLPAARSDMERRVLRAAEVLVNTDANGTGEAAVERCLGVLHELVRRLQTLKAAQRQIGTTP